jgi:hypothetical protein
MNPTAVSLSRTRSFSLAAMAGVMVALSIGCNQQGLTHLLVPDPAGGHNGQINPGIRFNWPAANARINDNEFGTIEYEVVTDRPMIARLVLDVDGDPSNGNEIDIASNRTFEAPGGSDRIEFIAGWYPYGDYFLRATLFDGETQYHASAPAVVSIQPSGNTNTDGAVPQDVAGLQMIYFSGASDTVDGRAPFVDTWHVLDVLDNLSPRFVMPFELDREVEVHRFQFFVFGRIHEMQKRLEIWQGTDENSPGTLLHQQNVTNASYLFGGWNNITVNPPITLAPGKYGVSYHAQYEFTDHWAANAPVGPGFVWLRANDESPYLRYTAADFGFVPNFTVRILGRFVGGDARAPTASGITIPRVPQNVTTSSGTPQTGSVDTGVYDYRNDQADALHVIWRRVE